MNSIWTANLVKEFNFCLVIYLSRHTGIIKNEYLNTGHNLVSTESSVAGELGRTEHQHISTF